MSKELTTEQKVVQATQYGLLKIVIFVLLQR